MREMNSPWRKVLSAGMENGGPPLLTALSYAASKGYTAIVDMLLKQGSPVNARARDGSTALIWAAKQGHFGTVSVLMRWGANPCVADLNGKNAIDYAAESGRRDIVDLLGGPRAAD
jgi:ankyrin repeat protein